MISCPNYFCSTLHRQHRSESAAAECVAKGRPTVGQSVRRVPNTDRTPREPLPDWMTTGTDAVLIERSTGLSTMVVGGQIVVTPDSVAFTEPDGPTTFTFMTRPQIGTDGTVIYRAHNCPLGTTHTIAPPGTSSVAAGIAERDTERVTSTIRSAIRGMGYATDVVGFDSRSIRDDLRDEATDLLAALDEYDRLHPASG